MLECASRPQRRRWGLMVLAVVLAPPALALDIQVLSNRGDLLSGGDALIEITLEAGEEPAALDLRLNGQPVNAQFARRSNGRVLGRLQGLAIGRNQFSAALPGASRAEIELRNHPLSGPIFSGPQVQPWECTTADAGLGEAQDPQCNAPPQIAYFYIPEDETQNLQCELPLGSIPAGTLVDIVQALNPVEVDTDALVDVLEAVLDPVESAETPCFQPYDPADPPDDVALTTTQDGLEVPFIVRLETGTMNRGIYSIAVLADPAAAWEPWAPQPAWNRKLMYLFSVGCGAKYTQGAPASVLKEDSKLGRGFMVATSSLNVLGSNCNTVTSAEAVMMLKEHIIERYGELRYTIGSGCSGGSIGQHMIANTYPGLVDGILPKCSFEDTWTIGNEILDCTWLVNYFDNAPAGLWPVANLPLQQALVDGHQLYSSCRLFVDKFTHVLDPRSDCRGPAAERYDPVDNPAGCRGTLQDLQVGIFGRRASDGFARTPQDNVGIQYGLRALNAGQISVEQFLDLNEKVGGMDIDANFTPERKQADPEALPIVYRSGQVNDARRLNQVPIIDLRASLNAEIHTDFHSYGMRARLEKVHGHADNQVIWTAPLVTALLPDGFGLIDEWLAAIEADDSADPLPEKVLRHKPAEAADACFAEDVRIDDPAICQRLFPHYAEARIAAGSPLAHDVMKCQLKPLDPADYPDPLPFDGEQWARLQAIFPDGVCDWSVPGVAQQPSVPWMSYAEGPGGQPLPPPPRAVLRPTAGRAQAQPARGGSLGIGLLLLGLWRIRARFP